MNKQERSKNNKRFNLLDVLIIFVVVALIGGGFYVYSQYTESLQKNKQAITYEVELKGVDQSFADAITKGDPLRESVKGNNLGNVEDKVVTAATNINTDYLKGAYVNVPVPDKLDVILKISAVAEVAEKNITVGGLEIKIGQKLYVKGKGYAKEGYILNIDVRK